MPQKAACSYARSLRVPSGSPSTVAALTPVKSKAAVSSGDRTSGIAVVSCLGIRPSASRRERRSALARIEQAPAPPSAAEQGSGLIARPPVTRRTWRISHLATSTSLAKGGPTPAFVLARVFAADGAGVAAYVRKRQRSTAVLTPGSWLLCSERSTASAIGETTAWSHERRAVADPSRRQCATSRIPASGRAVGCALSAHWRSPKDERRVPWQLKSGPCGLRASALHLRWPPPEDCQRRRSLV